MQPRMHAQRRFLAAKLARVREPHVAPISALADQIAVDSGLDPGMVPYPDPDGAGIEARVLFLLDNPGPRARAGSGSGLISMDNDDPTAERVWRANQRFGIDRARVLYWNIVPFPTEGMNSTTSEMRRAAPYTKQLLGMLPKVERVVLLGRKAEQGWRIAGLSTPLPPLVGPHPSNRGINAVKGNEALFVDVMQRVAGIVSA